MPGEPYRFPMLLLAAALIPSLVAILLVMSGANLRPTTPTDEHSAGAGTEPGSVERMREKLAAERKVLAGLEREQSSLRVEVIRRRKLLKEGQISKPEVIEAERLFVAALARVHALQHSVVETDIAITEAIWGEKVLRMPVLPVNGYSETPELARFNGGAGWSLNEAPHVERFFSRTFGRSLPVTARGQSATHNRLGFDHRDAMDVAVHPDSAEGKALIQQLRKAGIPFIAFRGAVPGASTGPHIHIGKPSRKL